MQEKAKPANLTAPATPKAQGKTKAAKTPVVKAPVVKPPKEEKAMKEDKPKKAKVKLIRDGFTIPENEYAVFDDLKKRCLQAGVHAKKGEVLRAALLNLSRLPDSEVVNAISQVEKLKTGRPAK